MLIRRFGHHEPSLHVSMSIHPDCLKVSCAPFHGRPLLSATPYLARAAHDHVVELPPHVGEALRVGVRAVGPDRECSPRHGMAINSRSEGSKCVG
jgi:hypothetical protein